MVDSQDFFTDPELAFARCWTSSAWRRTTGIAFERHNARARTPLDPALADRLEQHYRPYDEALATWWGKTPSWRR